MSVRTLKYGIYGGLAGGVVFGFMMGLMGMLPMIGQMVGSPSSVVRFRSPHGQQRHHRGRLCRGVGGLVAGMGSGVGYGLGYGVIWWLLGPLTLMPLFMGMGFAVNWNLEAATNMMPSLAGHLVYGAILGWTYACLTHRESVGIAGHRRVRAA